MTRSEVRFVECGQPVDDWHIPACGLEKGHEGAHARGEPTPEEDRAYSHGAEDERFNTVKWLREGAAFMQKGQHRDDVIVGACMEGIADSIEKGEHRA